MLSFIGNLERLSVENYLPLDEDILHADKRLIGITELVCNIGRHTFRMYELGGSRGGRKKWIHLFDDCSAFLFLVPIDEYDQRLLEDGSVVSSKLKKSRSGG